MNVVIVESPAKAKTINKYLGSDYTVLASYGHVRDLPPKDGSVKPDEDFAMSWQVDSKSQKRLSEIASAVKDADRLILATDPDREGEAISWHVLEVLQKKRVLKDKQIERVVFNAITKKAILEAMDNPRQLDTPLVDAYLARRALDYLVGFTLSPVLWRKLPGARSAGRVQSVALRLICDREMEIETFNPQEYWSIFAGMKTPAGDVFQAGLTGYDGKKIGRLDVKTGNEASAIKTMLDSASFKVDSVASKPAKRNPAAPFTTSTLQQEASRKLGFSASRTMQVAQKLYEGISIGGETSGLITYMRTDGVSIAGEAIAAARSVIGQDFGDKYVPEKPRAYSSKAKNAQEAHEAIRPTDLARRPKDVAAFLDQDQAKLYELIWKRTMASQMESAVLERTTIEILADGSGKRANLRATGSVVRFDGFLALYQESRDDDDEEGSKRLPAVDQGAALTATSIDGTAEPINSSQHFTTPPPRYTEASLVKKMEELGIGRPSTYASTLQTLRDREYVELEKKQLVPQDKGRIVTAFLESFFRRYVEFDFTASLEEQLDKISAGELSWLDVLKDFWTAFSGSVDEIKDLRVAEVIDSLNELLGPHIFPEKEDGTDPRKCPACDTGKLSLKVSRWGAFIGCENYPECGYTRQLGKPSGEEGEADDGPKVFGQDPETGMEVSLRTGRFGPYVQLGNEAKPKRSSLPKGWSAADMDLEKALQLLSLPREVGEHPEDGKMITAGLGRYGPFVLHDGTYANLSSPDEVFSVGINRAVDALAEKRAKGGGRRGAAATPLKELGEHPSEGGPVNVYDGRYGPYVKHGKVNATLPKDTAPEAVTMELAVELIAAKGGTKKKAAAKKTPAKKTTAKKTTTKKAAAKDGEEKTTSKKPAAKKTAAKKTTAKSAAKAEVDATSEEVPWDDPLLSAKRINTRKHTTRKHAKVPGDMPSREDILAFVADNPGRAGKREIARHFGIIGGARIHLKKILKDLAEDGLIEKRNKRMIRPGDLPPVFVANTVARTSDGDLLGTPVDWDDEAGNPPQILILAGKTKNTQPGLGDRALIRLSEGDSGSEAEFTARVIRVLEKRQGAILGILRKRDGNRPPYLEPIDRKQRELDVDPAEMKEAEDGDLVSVQISRSGKYGHPRAGIVERFGSMNSEKAVSEIALHSHGIPHVFPNAVEVQAESAKPVDKLGQREDWRQIPLVTIDPPDAKDHDDAVYAEPDENPDNEGGYVAYVAIADVAHYVTPGSPMDREANLRGNSVYFPDRVIPMLPERISNQLCSLREKEDKPAMGVRMVFDKTGRKISHTFHRVLMRSAAKLSYIQAQKAIDGVTDEKTETLLDGVLKPLWAAYAVLQKGREAREPLELDLPERKIKLKEDGTVDHVYVPERLDAHKLIEEFMIQANVAAAETLEKKKTPLLYRVHDASTPEKLENLKEFLSTIDMKLPSSGGLRPSVFNGILTKVKDTPQAHLVNEIVLRSQAQAEYNPQNIGHFGLNLRRYAHFTSPIRRYADLIVHRGLISALGLGKDGLPEGVESKLEAIGGEISGAERRAMLAERDTIDRLIALWMSDQVGATFQGRIAGVVKSGMFIRLEDTGADGFVPASTIGLDYYRYDEASHALIGDKTGETYQLGDQVEVRLVDAAPFAGSLTFEVVSHGRIAGKAIRKPMPKARRGPPKGGARGSATGGPKGPKGKAAPRKKTRR